jgi:hypothetical protein
MKIILITLLLCSYIMSKTTFSINLLSKETIDIEVNDGQDLKMTYRTYAIDLITEAKWNNNDNEYEIEFKTSASGMVDYLIQDGMIDQSQDIATFFGKVLKYDDDGSFIPWDAKAEKPLTEAQYKDNLKNLKLHNFIVLKEGEQFLQALF